MSRKSERIATLIEASQGQGHDPRYMAFFQCFNAGEYYEAHEVLENLWLSERKGPDDAFYKALIQLAGAFVHVQKNRLGPAKALLRLAQRNLGAYPAVHHEFELEVGLTLIGKWLVMLQDADAQSVPTILNPKPQLRLRPN